MITLKEFKKEYIETYSKGNHAPKTVAANDLALRKLIDFVGDVPLDQIETKHCMQFMSKQKENGLKPNSINNYFRHNKAAFNVAIKFGYLKKNPWVDVKPQKKEKQLPKFLTKHEIGKLLDGTENKDLRDIIEGLISTGRRRKELLCLLWEGVDTENNCYTVHTTKAHEIKKFRMSGPFRDLIQRLKLESNGSPYVFRQWKPDSVTHMIKRELIRIGRPDIHLHNLRHTFATLYLQHGGRIRTLQEFLGHASITTTEIYSGLTDEHLDEEIQRIKW